MVKPFSIVSDAKVGSPSIDKPLILVVGVVTDALVGEPFVTAYIQNEFFDMMDGDIIDSALNTEEFGEIASYKFSKSGKLLPAIQGIFDREYVDVVPNTDVGVTSSNPVWITWTKYFNDDISEGLNQGDTLADIMIIRGQRFVVQRHEPDGTGISVVFLHNG